MNKHPYLLQPSAAPVVQLAAKDNYDAHIKGSWLVMQTMLRNDRIYQKVMWAIRYGQAVVELDYE